MLRTILIVTVILVGIVASFYGSLNALMFYLWIAYFRPETWVWNNFVSGLNLSLFVGIYLLISTFVTSIKLKFTSFAGLLSLAVVHSLISTIMSNYSSVSFPYWMEFLKIAVISYLITMLIRSEKDLKITLIVISLSLGLEGAKQGWYHLLLHPGSINTNTHPVFGDNNGVAVGMLMLAPILLVLYQTMERKIFKYGFLFIAIGVIYRALSTYSRGGFLAFIAMCFIFWLRSEYKIRIALFVVLILAILLPTLPQQFWDRMDTITVNEGEVREASSANRIYFWKIAVEMANDNPLFGVGHNAYMSAYNTYDHSNGLYGRSRAAHSSWFSLLAEWGFLGLILYLSVYFYSLFSCAQARKKIKNYSKSKFLKNCIQGIETSLITGGVGITFLSLQYLEMLWHFFALAVAINQILRVQDATESATDAVHSKN